MALANDQTVTIDGTANALARVFEEANVGTFVGADKNLDLEVRPSTTRANRSRRVTTLRLSKNATDPLSGLGSRVATNITLVVDAPPIGYSDDDLTKAVTGFITWLTAGTNANLKKVIAGEN